jgi:capsular exopolysaccharide synthesis family protein
MEPENHPALKSAESSHLDPGRRAEVILRQPALRSPYYAGAVDHTPERHDPSDPEGGLVDYWRMLMHHKRALILAAFAGLVIGFGIGIPMKPVYRVRTSIEVLNINQDFMNMKQTNPVNTNDSSEDVSEEQTQTKLLQSNALMRRVLNKLNPSAQPPAKGNTPPSGWRSWLHLKEPVQLTERQKLLSSLVRSLKVNPTTHTRMIEVTADSTDPQLAALFANTLIGEFIQQNLEDRFATSHRTSDWLTREIDDARDTLKKSEKALQAYARESGLIFTDENTNVATEKLQQLLQQLSAATSDRITKQARYELAKNSPPSTVAEVVSDEGLEDITAKLTELERQVADLSAIYNPEYPELKRAQASLSVVQGVFERTRADILTRIGNEYHESVSKEKLLATAYDEQTREVTGQDEKAIQYNILKREVDSGRQLYDTMLQQTKQSSIASALRASNVRVVDPAEDPGAPFFPNYPMNSGIGMFTGLLFCIAILTIRENADRTLKRPGDTKLWTNLAELGTIPGFGVAKSYWPRDADTGRGDQPELISPQNRKIVELATLNQKPSLIAESFRSTLSSILFAGENGSRPRVLVFTSAHPADGKTTVVSNLAIAAAEIRRKVLIIDADLRRPCVQDIFNVSNDRGLSDALREELSEQNVMGLIQETGISNLHVLPAGKPTHAAAHLLYSRNFAPLLEKLKREYDMTFVDTPPMLQMTDARVVGRLADAVVLVARAGVTTRNSIVAAKDRLDEDQIRVLGSVLNDWDPRKSASGYYGRYEYRSYAK